MYCIIIILFFFVCTNKPQRLETRWRRGRLLSSGHLRVTARLWWLIMIRDVCVCFLNAFFCRIKKKEERLDALCGRWWEEIWKFFHTAVVVYLCYMMIRCATIWTVKNADDDGLWWSGEFNSYIQLHGRLLCQTAIIARARNWTQ